MNAPATLGFAIPAYRRPELLDLALNSLVVQARSLQAPIYIADDSCDQTNVMVVQRWKKTYSNIIHEINEENLGIDRNIDRAILRCPAKYVHVIGDDDQILPGFSDQVLRVITELKPNHIVCSYTYTANDFRPISGAIIPRLPKETTLREFLQQYGWALGFIGANVFRRDLFAACNADGFGTYFHHLIRLIRYLDPDEPLGFVVDPLVANRAGDESTATWSGDRLNVVFGLEKSLSFAMSQRYSTAEIERTVLAARRRSGYTQYFRLLYWAALADSSGDAGRYWSTLRGFISPARYWRLRAVPKFLNRPLLTLIPAVRRTKRFIRGFGTGQK